MSFQNFFKLFKQLSGATGTVDTAADEFWHVYRLCRVGIPTHKKCRRRVLSTKYFATAEDKWEAVIREIQSVCEEERSILLGVQSVATSEYIAERLDGKKIEYKLLNATKHEEEAEIVSQAGQPGRVTIATNMAGRGTDIKLDEPGARALLSVWRMSLSNATTVRICWRKLSFC